MVIVAGIRIEALTQAQALERLATRNERCLKVCFANAHLVNIARRNDALRAALTEFLILPDGVGIDLAARMRGVRLPANLNGTDLVPAILASSAPLRIGLLGAAPGVAEKASRHIRFRYPSHEVVVVGHGFGADGAIADRIATLVADPVDLLLVAMGNPRQEDVISRMIDRRHARVAMGVGALFDFMAGHVRRAPVWVRTVRCEWIWRMALEPSRLWRRYILGNPVFLFNALVDARSDRAEMAKCGPMEKDGATGSP